MKDLCIKNVIEEEIKTMSKGIMGISYYEVEQVVNKIMKIYENDGSLFFTGNGGSASTCTHFSQDLATAFMTYKQKPLKTFSLTDNVSYITAMGNDIGFEDIFSRQIRQLFRENDALFIFSASGNSPNLVKAMREARKLNGTVVGITGFDGGVIAKECDLFINTFSAYGEYGLVESVQLGICHIISNTLRKLLAKEGNEEMYCENLEQIECV
jgi:D-sedoheptulose 7-phosphate isomerase